MGKCSFFVTNRHTLHHNIYVYRHHYHCCGHCCRTPRPCNRSWLTIGSCFFASWFVRQGTLLECIRHCWQDRSNDYQHQHISLRCKMQEVFTHLCFINCEPIADVPLLKQRAVTPKVWLNFLSCLGGTGSELTIGWHIPSWTICKNRELCEQSNRVTLGWDVWEWEKRE